MIAISGLLRGHFPQCSLANGHAMTENAGPDGGPDGGRRNLFTLAVCQVPFLRTTVHIFLFSLRSQIICNPTFKFVPPLLFAFLI